MEPTEAPVPERIVSTNAIDQEGLASARPKSQLTQAQKEPEELPQVEGRARLNTSVIAFTKAQNPGDKSELRNQA